MRDRLTALAYLAVGIAAVTVVLALLAVQAIRDRRALRRCGCGEPDCGYAEVADRMDRWAAGGYRGDWLDDRYAPDGGERDGG